MGGLLWGGCARAAAAAALFVVAGCASGGGGAAPAASGGGSGVGSALSNLVFWGATTVPPAPPLPTDDDFECPSIMISGASHRVGGDAVRVQYSLGDVARECLNIRPDGAHTLKIGAQGIVLLGPAGAPGRYDVSVRFVVKDGSQVLATRVARRSVTIPVGDSQAAFTIVEDGLQVPGGHKNRAEIEVGFGSAPAAPRRRAGR